MFLHVVPDSMLTLSATHYHCLRVSTAKRAAPAFPQREPRSTLTLSVTHCPFVDGSTGRLSSLPNRTARSSWLMPPQPCVMLGRPLVIACMHSDRASTIHATPV